MAQTRKATSYLEAYPALREVLTWWSDKRVAHKGLQKLRKEILKIRRCPERLEAVARSAADFLGERGEAGEVVRLEKLDPALHRLLWNFAIADEIALRYHGTQRWTCRWLLLLVGFFGAGFWLMGYGNVILPDLKCFGGIPLGAVAGASLIVVAGVASFFARWRFRQQRGRYLVSRTLGETLRVDLAQRLAGTGLNTEAEYARQHEVADHAAFPRAVLTAALECAGAPPSSPQADGLELARALWIEEQLRFFGEPGAQKDPAPAGLSRVEVERGLQRRAERRLKAGVAFIILFLVLSLGMRVLPHLPAFQESWRHGVAALGAFSELCTALFGLWVAYYHQVAALHAVTAQKYHRARIYLIDALEALKGELRAEGRRAIFARLGKQALAESADWGVHQREHTPRASFR